MYSLDELLDLTMEKKASDLHLTVGVPPILRIDGELRKVSDEVLYQDEVEKFAKEILKDRFEEYVNDGELDTSYSSSGVGRFRVNVYKQRGSDAIAIRAVGLAIPTIESLRLPLILKDLTEKQRGLVLVTGPTGSGKSTTLAAMINEINQKTSRHIITLEDPIEFLHKHNKSIINQREIGKDTKSYANGLRAILREDPDVILIGEMRDPESIEIALTAAETGHLVFSTLHTVGASKTVDRIVDVFSPYQQQQIRIQLSTVLQGIVSQQLIPRDDIKGRSAAIEIMINTPAIANMIREGKSHQIQSSVQTGSKYGMKTMDMALIELYKKGEISLESALAYSVDKEILLRMSQL